MLTLRDINRALDRLGVDAFIPQTRRLQELRVAARTERMVVRADRVAPPALPYVPLADEES
jgi:hypothetical protein